MTIEQLKEREQQKAFESGVSEADFERWWKEEFSADPEHLAPYQYPKQR
jgi:hypothetical protein